MEITDKVSAKRAIFDAFLTGNFDTSDSLKQKYGFSEDEIKTVAEKAYQNLMKGKKIPLAIKVCERCSLPSEMRSEAVNLQFRVLNADKRYEEAIQWGLDYKIPRNDINNTAVKAFSIALENRDVEKALELKRKHEIPETLIAAAGLPSFNIFFQQKEYVKAMLIGQEFHVSRKRMLTAGIRGFYQLLRKDEIQKFVALEKQYNILGDKEIVSIDENDMTLFLNIFIKNVVNTFLSDAKAAELSKVIDDLQIFEKHENNPLLPMMLKQVAEEVAIVHNELMDEGNYADAHRLIESFHLLKDEISYDVRTQIIAAAEKAHHRLIGEDNLPAAKIIKDNYGLFGKNLIGDSIETVIEIVSKYLEKALENGDIKNAQYCIEEYNLPLPVVHDTGRKALIRMLQSKKFIEAFDAIKLLKIPVNNPAVNAEAAEHFDEAFTGKKLELASNIGYYFKLKDKRVVKAAFVIWHKYMEAGRYTEAGELKKIHKIPNKLTEPVVKENYRKLMREGETEQAVYLRNEYGINLTIVELIVEFVKKIFKL